MDKYLALEKRLAELLGYRDIFRLKVDGVEHGGLHYNKSTFTGGEKVPRWTRDWSACGPLMAEHGLATQVQNELHTAQVSTVDGPIVLRIERFADHPDKDTAVRYAIVQAVIAKLESERGKA